MSESSREGGVSRSVAVPGSISLPDSRNSPFTSKKICSASKQPHATNTLPSGTVICTICVAVGLFHWKPSTCQMMLWCDADTALGVVANTIMKMPSANSTAPANTAIKMICAMANHPTTTNTTSEFEFECELGFDE